MSERDDSLLMIIAGPAGSGKTTLCDKMLEVFGGQIERVITCTTRMPRRNELHGRDYYFYSESEFMELVHKDAFYEHAHVYSQHYGTLKKEILSKLQEKKIDLLLNTDVQGAMTIFNKAKGEVFLRERLVSVFIMPPSLDELRKRLFTRGENSTIDIERRVAIASEEIKYKENFKYIIYGSTREKDFNTLKDIYLSEKKRLKGTDEY